MSLLSKLFGGAKGKAQEPTSTEHQGYRITPEPAREGSKFRIGARIEKDIDGETKTHKLVRADVMDSHDDAVTVSINKAKQMIDEQGERIFRA